MPGFDIDDGSIDRLDNKLCFIMGVEYESLRLKLKMNDDEFWGNYQAENERRLTALACGFSRQPTVECFSPGYIRMRFPPATLTHHFRPSSGQ